MQATTLHTIIKSIDHYKCYRIMRYTSILLFLSFLLFHYWRNSDFTIAGNKNIIGFK